jgi:hypothetical protein
MESLNFIKHLCLGIVALLLSRATANCSESSLIGESKRPAESEHVLGFQTINAENAELRQKVETLQRQLSRSITESEIVKRQVSDMTLRIEALGASVSNPTALEQKVLQAANSARISSEIQAESLTQLARISKLITELKNSLTSEYRLVLDSELKRVDEFFAKMAFDVHSVSNSPNLEARNIQTGKVIAVKPELECVVLNLGYNQGAKAGMPFLVKRNEKHIATIRVVQVRKTFSAAVIQDPAPQKESIKLGDTITVGTQL